MSQRIPLELIRNAQRAAGCSGSCAQGRACDCVPDFPEPVEEPLSAAERAAVFGILLVSALIGGCFLAWTVASILGVMR